jgi:hypothetical protein
LKDTTIDLENCVAAASAVFSITLYRVLFRFASFDSIFFLTSKTACEQQTQPSIDLNGKME